MSGVLNFEGSLTKILLMCLVVISPKNNCVTIICRFICCCYTKWMRLKLILSDSWSQIWITLRRIIYTFVWREIFVGKNPKIYTMFRPLIAH